MEFAVEPNRLSVRSYHIRYLYRQPINDTSEPKKNWSDKKITELSQIFEHSIACM